ncbi:unnamed protein product [Candidula unifasciata]|uniref:Uncharacterized protein n=1 Tax=Candidula unifasciata TaxID=100452 RepID=A0A8S3YT53_9EUPU|nr:unnamed protein product [Candidula unifasciata]
MATTHVCSNDVRWHTNALTRMAMDTAGQNNYVHTNNNVMFERLATQCGFQKHFMSSDHADCLCSDCGMDSDADGEFAESATTPNTTHLNANTNGVATKDAHGRAARNKTDGTGFKTVSVDETEIQLDTVGLSLSGSGMHLYVKADTDEKKKLLADTYVQLTAKPMKEKGSRNRNVMKLSTLTSDNADSEDYYQEINKKSSEDNDSYWKDTTRYDKQTIKVFRTNDVQGEQLSLLNSSPQTFEECTHTCRECGQCKKAYASNHRKLPAREEINRKTVSKKITPMLDKFNSQEMVSKNNKFYGRDSVYENKKHNNQQTYSHTYDTLKRQKAEDLGANYQHKRSKYADPQVYRQKKQQLMLLNNHNHSSNNDDNIAYETGCENRRKSRKMNLMTSPMPCQRNDNNHGTFMVNNELTCNAAGIQTEPTCSASTKQVSPMSIPYSTYSNSAAYEGVSLSNFIDYADNIRKNLKEDYRNISNLIKEFSDEMQERNNNGSSQIETVKSKKDRKTKNSKENCVVM